MTTELKNGLEINEYGNKRWYKDGLLHREDGLAIEWENGKVEYWLNGVR